MRESGIKSIISLMHDKELAYYSSLDLRAPDLIGFYASQGFEVRRITWEDPAHSKASRILIQKKLLEVRTLVLEAFDALPKPALLHCSAGIDRSSPVAAFLAVHRERS
jgi:protein tyrosine/serine phosphatase